MKLFYTLVLSFVFSHAYSINITPGSWLGKLSIKTTVFLPFHFSVNQPKSEQKIPSIVIFNGEEKIILSGKKTNSDSIDYVFPNFNSFIRIHLNNKNNLSGFWYNKSKGDDYKILFSASYLKKKTPSAKNTPNVFSGKWSTVFAPNTKDEEVAYGVFKQENNKMSGTFLTETGDYRFLAGKTNGKKFILSCFDGAHAFLFTANLSKNKDSIFGKFYSGIHWESDWFAVKSTISPLRNPDSITYIVDNRPFKFAFNDLDGQAYHYPNTTLKNKVVIVQILGTWCPNCLDESRYFKTLYDKYHKDGLEIISIAYERSDELLERLATIKKYKQVNDLNFTYLDGGCYCDKLVEKDFNMLNSFSSYPTSFFINRAGKIVLIHTGFSGPGTGEYYTEYTKKTESLVRKLLYDR